MSLHHTLIDYLLFEGFRHEIRTLALYSVGIAIYGLFIYFFYENLSRRNLLGERWQDPDYGPFTLLVRGIRYILVFPVVSFAFFTLLSFAFLFFSATGQVTVTQTTFVNQVLLVAMAIVTSVRITAYISEPTSHDIAKLLPLGMLAVFIVNLDLEAAVLEQTVSRFREYLSFEILTGVVLRYFIFLIVLESVLRLVYLTVRPITGDDDEDDEADKTEIYMDSPDDGD